MFIRLSIALITLFFGVASAAEKLTLKQAHARVSESPRILAGEAPVKSTEGELASAEGLLYPQVSVHVVGAVALMDRPGGGTGGKCGYFCFIMGPSLIPSGLRCFSFGMCHS